VRMQRLGERNTKGACVCQLAKKTVEVLPSCLRQEAAAAPGPDDDAGLAVDLRRAMRLLYTPLGRIFNRVFDLPFSTKVTL
jgi:hypothetical protein